MSDPHGLEPLPHDEGSPGVRYMFTGIPPRTIHVDAAVAELWGVSAREIHRHAALWLAGVHEDDRERVVAAWASPLAQRWDLVYRVVRPDGSTIWVRDQGIALQGGRSRQGQVSGCVREVSAQHELEERLRFHSQLLDAVGQAVVATDTDGLVTFWNRAAEELYGWTAAEAMGRSVIDVLAPGEHEDEVRAVLRHHLDCQVAKSGEVVARHRDGRELVVETRTSPLVDGTGKMIGRVGADIGVRKHAERRLRASEERFRAVFEHAGLGMAIRAPDGRVLLANAALGHFLGFDGAELETLDLCALSHPADWEIERPQLEAVLRGGLASHSFEHRYRHRDGGFVWARVTVTPVRDEDGRSLYAVAVVEDIEARRRAQEQLRQSREELQRLYAHLHLVRESEQGRIARDLHDQLGQMLTALKLDVAWLQRRARSGELVREQAAKRLEQTAQLVDETLVTTRRIAMQLRPVVLDDLGLEAAIEWLVEEVGRRAGFDWSLDTDLRDLPADVARDTAAYRILQEALTNVARHAAARRVQVKAVHRGGELRLSVRDDGCGIAAGALRAPGSMGLAGMRERAHAFGGRLTVRRLAGGGTRVSARFPDAPPA